jgi:hypothetical protein
MLMPTQIVLEDQLIQQAIAISGINSPQILIEKIVQDFIHQAAPPVPQEITLRDWLNKPAMGQRTRKEIDQQLEQERNCWEVE